MTEPAPSRWKRRWRFVCAFLVAAFVGVTVDAIFHLHIASFVAMLPIVWVAYVTGRDAKRR